LERQQRAESGDPAKLAQALITISSKEKPPRRFITGADAVGTADKVAVTLQQQTDAYLELSSSVAYDKAQPHALTVLFKSTLHLRSNHSFY
jgi:hypothetical protein